MLRSDTLMLDNKLFPLYQERVTFLTFTTEHNNEHFESDDELCEKSLVILTVGRCSENRRTSSNVDKCKHKSFFTV